MSKPSFPQDGQLLTILNEIESSIHLSLIEGTIKSFQIIEESPSLLALEGDIETPSIRR